MNAAFFVAFGGPVALALTGCAILLIMERHARKVPHAGCEEESVAQTLLDAESAARRAAEAIARAREQIALH